VKRLRRGNMLFTGLLLAFILVIILTSLTYSPKARLIPLIIGGGTLVLAILALLSEFYPGLLRTLDVSLMDFAASGAAIEPGSEQPSGVKVAKRVLNMSMWLAIFFVLIYLVGFLISIGVFVLLFLKVYGKIGWVKTIAVSAITWGFIYGTFEVFIKVELFRGILFGAIVPPI